MCIVFTVFTSTVYVGTFVGGGTRSRLKPCGARAIFVSFPPLADSGSTVRYRSTKVHVGPSGPSPSRAPSGAPAQLCAPEELVKLTEALVSTIERELTRRSSLRGDLTIDDVGSKSVAKPATTTKTLHGDGSGISCCASVRSTGSLTCATGAELPKTPHAQ